MQPPRPRSTTPHSQLTRQLSKNEDEGPPTNSKPGHRPHSREGGKRSGHDERTHNARNDPNYDPSNDGHFQDRRRESRYSMRDRTPDRDRSTSSERTTMTERHGREPAKYSGRDKQYGPDREHFTEQEPRRFQNQDHFRDHGRYVEHERERYGHGYDNQDRRGYPDDRYYAADHERGRHYTKEPLTRQVSGRTLDRQRRMYGDEPPSPHYPHERYPEHASFLSR